MIFYLVLVPPWIAFRTDFASIPIIPFQILHPPLSVCKSLKYQFRIILLTSMFDSDKWLEKNNI